jgi:N-acetylneuraminic acid mutarotase
MNTIQRLCLHRLLVAPLVLVAAAVAAEPGTPTGGRWVVAAPSPIFASEHGATVVENKIYVAGGFAGPNQNWTGTTNAFVVFDPASNSWATLAPLPKKLHHFGIATLDNKIYVTGGFTDEDFELDNKAAYVYTPTSTGGGSWASIADLPAERGAHVSVAVGGLLYVIGGVGNDTESIRAYNPATNTWDSGRAQMPTTREHLTAAVVNGRIYVIAGRAGPQNLSAVEEYNPATNAWTVKAGIPTARSGITSGVLNGRIHVTGGEDHLSGETLASHEVYDPATNQWSALASMPTGRHGLASGVASGRWYVIGGGLVVGGGTFSSLTNVVEAFDPSLTGTLPPPPEGGRLANVSVLSALSSPGDSFSLGFVTGGENSTGSKPLLIRAVGPSLLPLIGTGALEDPRLDLFAGTNKTGENDNWGGASPFALEMASVGAFAFAGAASRDAALLVNVPRGDHSVRISATGNGTGTVLAEIYELPAPAGSAAATMRLSNVSVLKQVGSGFTVGFVVAGLTSGTVLIRAVGPTLATAPFNVTGAIADPQIALYAGATRMNENNDWTGTVALTSTFSHVGAFALPVGSRDAALTASLAPGNYSVQVSGVSGSTGLVLVEIYDVR